jgi:hypothetical protein
LAVKFDVEEPSGFKVETNEPPPFMVAKPPVPLPDTTSKVPVLCPSVNSAKTKLQRRLP